MISAPVRVVSSADGIAMVEPTEKSGCGGCASSSRCGVSGLGKYFSHNRKTIAVQCDANVRAGDELQLQLSEGDLLKAGMLAYVLPCVLALFAAAIAARWGDAAAVLGAAAGLTAGFVLGRFTGWAPQVVAQRNN